MPAAVAAGDYLAVVGDVHPGANPLMQGVFGHRHPRFEEFVGRIEAEYRPRMAYLLPPWGPGLGVDARGVAVTPPSWIHIAAMPGGRAQGDVRTWTPHELLVDGDDLVDRTGELRVPLRDVFGGPIFVTGVRTFELTPDEPHAPRLTIGRTVLRREGWSVPTAGLPERPEALPAFLRARGMPRRLFAKSPLERKPMYLDADSPVPARILLHHARQAAIESPGAQIRFSEMLPAPEQTWLRDPDGNRFVSELRLVAVDAMLLPAAR